MYSPTTTIPGRSMLDLVNHTPTLLTSSADLPTPANCAGEVFTYDKGSKRWKNAAGTAVEAPVPQNTSASVVIQSNGGLLNLLPYVTGADGATLTFIVFELMRVVSDGDPSIIQWIKRAATGIFTATAGTKTGDAGGVITDSHRYIDTLANALERGIEPLATRVNGPASGSEDNGFVTLVAPDPTSARMWQVYGKIGTATAFGFASAEISGGG